MGFKRKPQIRFHYDGVNYVVDYEACELNKIVLPDARVLEVGIWYESYPPQPGELTEVPHLFKDFPLGEIARNLNAALAHRSDS